MRRHHHLNPSRSLRFILAAFLLLLVVSAGWGATDDEQTASAASRVTPQKYYLALGDSITYGIQPTKAKPTPSAFRSGYVDVFAARLRKLSPQLEVVNYGCPGESTVTFTRGGCPALADRIKLHDAFRGSQLDAAVSFLAAHPGEVSPITLTLYGNDWLALLLDTCKSNVACVR